MNGLLIFVGGTALILISYALISLWREHVKGAQPPPDNLEAREHVKLQDIAHIWQDTEAERLEQARRRRGVSSSKNDRELV